MFHGVRMWEHVSFFLSESTRLRDGQEGLGNTVRCMTSSRKIKTIIPEDENVSANLRMNC